MAAFLISFAVMLGQMSLARQLDVAVHPFASSIFIGMALGWLSLGFAYGVRLTRQRLLLLLSSFCLTLIFCGPMVNAISAWLEPTHFSLLYVTLVLFLLGAPFFFAGTLLLAALSTGSFHQRYALDFLGAAIAAFIAPFLIPTFYPGGLLLLAVFMALVGGLFLVEPRLRYKFLAGGAGVLLLVSPFYESLEIRRLEARHWPMNQSGVVEDSLWGTTSRLDLLRLNDKIKTRYVFFDGGTMGTNIYAFDGDFVKLRENYRENLYENFSRLDVALSHHLKFGDNSDVLIFGPGAGQEIKAALMYEAKRVDAVEMNEGLYPLLKRNYWSYLGPIFDDPRVSLHIGEGRAFLRSNENTYDIIQVFSNYVSSSAVSGTGPFQAEYLLTKEAFMAYFSRLKKDGILQLNQFYFLNILRTAEEAWRTSGRENFYDHLLVVRDNGQRYNLTTILLRESSWTPALIEKVKQFFKIDTSPGGFFLFHEPLQPKLAVSLSQKLHQQQRVAQDDRPFLTDLLGGGLAFMAQTFRPLKLAQAFLLLLGLIGSIIWLRRKKSLNSLPLADWLLFFSMGLGFYFAEIFLVNGFALTFAQPVFSFSTLLAAMFLGTAAGSIWSRLQSERTGKFIPLILAAVCFGAGIGFDNLRVGLLEFSPFISTALAVLVSLLAGTLMGCVFPFNLRRLNLADEKLATPFVLSGLAAFIVAPFVPLLVLEFGFHFLLYCAAVSYFLVFWNIRKSNARGSH